MFNHQILTNILIQHDCKNLLDIGANNGDWAIQQKMFMPSLNILCIEGNEKCGPFLDNKHLDYIIALLSNTTKQVRFYLNKKDNICTGSSYYLENTEHYDKYIYILKTTTTLDDILGIKNTNYDCMKLDTQGSEIDILRGMSDISNIKIICLEVSISEYNKEAPLMDEVVKYMRYRHFKPTIDTGNAFLPDGKMFQKDIIFNKI